MLDDDRCYASVLGFREAQEELWSRLGHETSVALADWPAFDPAKTVDDLIEVAVQVNGKLRGTITAARDAAKDDLEAAARDNANVKSHLEGKTVVKVIVVPDKLVNFAVKG